MQRLVRALDWDLREGRCASTVSENTVEVITFGGSMTVRIEFKTPTYNADAEACEDGNKSVRTWEYDCCRLSPSEFSRMSRIGGYKV